MTIKKATRPDIHSEVTNQIIGLLDQVDPEDYQSPFAGLAAQGLPINPTTDSYYNGVNILALWFNQQTGNFSSNHWATFKQWKDNGAQVRKGEKGSRVIFYKTLIKTEENKKGELEDQKIPMLKLYTVFNANQVDGYEQEELSQPVDTVERLELIDQFCRKSGVKIKHGNGGAYYQRVEDYINIPETKYFQDTDKANATENYYATLLHELTHWTGAPHRLNRDKAKTKLEREKIAFEELIAELGAAFLCAKHNIAQSLPENHAIYIKGWLQALREDKTHIFKAAAAAAKAMEYLETFQTNHSEREIT